MDETAISFNMTNTTTIEEKGTKTISIASTGHECSMFTVILSCLANAEANINNEEGDGENGKDSEERNGKDNKKDSENNETANYDNENNNTNEDLFVYIDYYGENEDAN
ncbi:11260_t:CDS:2, partial [Dentiscutata erythropus]